MLDLETMSTKPNAAIIAIGAVAFNETGIVDKFYIQVRLSSCKENGLDIDPSTIIWWMKQGEEARSKFFDNETASDLVSALDSFSAFYSQHGGAIWGNGAAFDNVILRSAYESIGVEAPWPFWVDSCYRTIKNMNPIIELRRVGVHHNALDDAETQALHLLEIIKSK